jgi:hypothetical protein
MAIALVAGVVLWLYGSRLIKPIFGVLGIAIGALIGVVLPPAVGIDQIGDVSGWVVGLGLGAVVGLVVAMVLLKIGITFTAGLAFAIAGFMGALVFLQYNPAPPGTADRPMAIDTPSRPTDNAGQPLFRNMLSGQLASLSQLVETEPETSEERILLMAARVRAVLSESQRFVAEQWQALAVRDRTILLGATTTALALGLLAGLFVPRRSSALVTALLGSAIWLVALSWLIEGVPWLGFARGAIEARTPTFWAIVWGIASTIGFVAQVGGLARGGRKKNDDNDDD